MARNRSSIGSRHTRLCASTIHSSAPERHVNVCEACNTVVGSFNLTRPHGFGFIQHPNRTGDLQGTKRSLVFTCFRISYYSVSYLFTWYKPSLEGMQPHGQTPVRPVPLQGGADLQQLLEIVRVQQQQQSQQPNRSAFSTLPTQQALLPEFQLYHAAQLSGLLVNNNQANAGEPLQLAQLQQLHNLSNQANILNVPGGSLPDSSTTRNPPARPASRSNEKSSTAYASRHQAAEQRRRNRINDRYLRTTATVCVIQPPVNVITKHPTDASVSCTEPVCRWPPIVSRFWTSRVQMAPSMEDCHHWTPTFACYVSFRLIECREVV